jgi:hypothetical protein
MKMNKTRTVLCVLIALALMVPLAISIVPAVQADAGEAQEQAVQAELEGQPGATLYYYYPPLFYEYYYCKGTLNVYDWLGNKIARYRDGWLYFWCQDTDIGHYVEFYWSAPAYPAPGQTPVGKLPPGGIPSPPTGPNKIIGSIRPPPDKNATPTLPQIKSPTAPCVGANGYVGLTLINDKYKCKNKPRLSSFYWAGTWYDYPTSNFEHYTLNAQVKKVDYTMWTAEKIKGIVEGWGQYPPTLTIDGSPSVVQYEMKFNATPTW